MFTRNRFKFTYREIITRRKHLPGIFSGWSASNQLTRSMQMWFANYGDEHKIQREMCFSFIFVWLDVTSSKPKNFICPRFDDFENNSDRFACKLVSARLNLTDIRTILALVIKALRGFIQMELTVRCRRVEDSLLIGWRNSSNCLSLAINSVKSRLIEVNLFQWNYTNKAKSNLRLLALNYEGEDSFGEAHRSN